MAKLSIKKLWHLIFAVLVILIVYLPYFFHGHSFRQFLGMQKWIYIFYQQGAKAIPGSFITMFFTGKWPTWWGTIEQVAEWHPFWPIMTIISLIWIIYLIFKRKIGNLKIVAIWLLIYTVFLFNIPVWPRYFLLIIPFLYLITVHFIFSVYKTIIQSKLHPKIT